MSGVAVPSSKPAVDISRKLTLFVLGILFFQNNVKFSDIEVSVTFQDGYVIMTMTYKDAVFKATFNTSDLSVEFVIPPAVHENSPKSHLTDWMDGKCCNAPQIFNDDWMMEEHHPIKVFECTQFVKDEDFTGLCTFMRNNNVVFSDKFIEMVENIIETLSMI
jgi:hypothetical protein